MNTERPYSGNAGYKAAKISREIETRDRLPEELPGGISHLSLIRNLIFPTSIAESVPVRETSIRYYRTIKKITATGKEKYLGVQIIESSPESSVRSKKPPGGGQQYEDVIEKEEYEITFDPYSAEDKARAIKEAYAHRTNLEIMPDTEIISPVYERVRYKKDVWFPAKTKRDGTVISPTIVEVSADHCVVLPGQPNPENEKYKFEEYNVFEIELMKWDKKIDKYKFLIKLKQFATDSLMSKGIRLEKAGSKREWLLGLQAEDGLTQNMPGYSFPKALTRKAA